MAFHYASHFWSCPARREFGFFWFFKILNFIFFSYYPDYYDEIKEPMSLFVVNKKLKRGEYKKLSELEHDLLLIFDNARSYNLESSDIYSAAIKLDKLVRRKTRELQDQGKRSRILKPPKPSVYILIFVYGQWRMQSGRGRAGG